MCCFRLCRCGWNRWNCGCGCGCNNSGCGCGSNSGCSCGGSNSGCGCSNDSGCGCGCGSNSGCGCGCSCGGGNNSGCGGHDICADARQTGKASAMAIGKASTMQPGAIQAAAAPPPARPEDLVQLSPKTAAAVTTNRNWQTTGIRNRTSYEALFCIFSVLHLLFFTHSFFPNHLYITDNH